ncbi:UDP-N-acetylglucosamine 1-carboxyvinyltransferase [Patescibacteria group bacterium]|nr:UDP-N-acetylglucosamine 1-carboxyvinyltransferase [Patescibacteria group bacterium]
MGSLLIEGGRPLHGQITVQGAKNATTPIVAACLLTQEVVKLNNVPQIADVEKMLALLVGLGAKVVRQGESVQIEAKEISAAKLDRALVRSMRSSVLMFGPLLSRLGEVSLPEPGGCIIGNRPLAAHFVGLKQLGAKVEQVEDSYVLKANGLHGAQIVLPEFSVTATENIIMAAVLAKGLTTIELAAAEPHVQDLCNFLNKLGAQISGIGTHKLVIEGVSKLTGGEHTIIPDMVEAGTWAVLAAVGRGEIKINSIMPEHLSIVLLKLKEIGVDFTLEENSLIVRASRQLKPFKLQTMPYPGFATDLQAPFAVLATQASGSSLIHDPLYEGRLNHIAELTKMGANAVVADPHRVIINGPTPLYGREIRSFDLRAGATLIIAGLIAEGQTVINDLEIVDRGYQHLVERLTTLGAKVKRV